MSALFTACVAGTAFFVATVAGTAAQSNQVSAGSASPAFEVASIKPIGSPGGLPVFGSIGFPPGGQFVAQSVGLIAILRVAYPNFGSPGQIAGGPDWVRTELFEINARAGGNPPRAVMSDMLKQLLADRFRLRTHIEPREVDAYALVLARPNGRPGPGLRKSAVDCEAREAARRAAIAAGAPPTPQAIPECEWSSRTMNGVVQLVSRGYSLSRLVAHIQANVGRAVVDRTGLPGQFDITLEHAMTEAPSTTGDQAKALPLFTAIQDQLGLKLESRKERMEVLVIDQVEMPTPN